MPLKKGASQKPGSSTIKMLVHDYERTGHIGNSTPASKHNAIKQAVAISLSKARNTRTKKA